MSTRFSDLMKLDKNDHDLISMKALRKELTDTPNDILEYFYSHHGRKDVFQRQYADLEINKIIWKKKYLSASEIVSCDCYSMFSEWMSNVQARISSFKTKGWNCIDVRNEIVKHWEEFLTWELPPIFIEKEMLNKSNGLWLVEGHTRVGVLRGLVEHSIVHNQSTHEIWLGSYC